MSATPNPAEASIAVIGGGSIGTSWAIVFARVGHPVRLYDPDPQRRDVASAEILERLAALAEAEIIAESPRVIAARVTVHAELRTALDGAVHVQECAPEQLELKRALFAELDELAGPDAVLASSSSAITISETASGLAGCCRCLVVHPANPPHLLPVVELVPADFTDPGVVERTAALLRGAGMSPVRVNFEIEGFVYNRLQGAVLREAYCLVRDGVISVDELDRVVREGLGRRWAVIGPFETVDLNTRGGIGVHGPRMRDAYARMGALRGQDDPWTDDLIEQVTAERRAQMPLSEWDERVAWRDRVLIRLEHARRQVDRAEFPDN
jgi:3-hydroxyacyl-CoA dehydrogenase